MGVAAEQLQVIADCLLDFGIAWQGTTVAKAEQLPGALAAALAHDGPALVEVMTDALLV